MTCRGTHLGENGFPVPSTSICKSWEWLRICEIIKTGKAETFYLLCHNWVLLPDCICNCPAPYKVQCLSTFSLHLQKSRARGHSMAALLPLEQLQEGLLPPLQSLPLGNQETHVTAWWHSQMPCAALPITPDYELSKEAFLSFRSCFCKSDLLFFHEFSSKAWLCFYAQSIPSATHLYLLMAWGVYPCRKTRSSLQPSPTTTASACFRPWGNAAAQGNGSGRHQPSSERLGRACREGGGQMEG